MSRFLAALALLAVLLAATNEWPTWEGGIRLLEASDVRSYEAIAAAAPDLPEQDLPAQHARRFVPHWALGAAAEATGVELHALYWVAWGLLVVAIVAAVHLTLGRLGAGRGVYWLTIGLLIANAYAFRYYAIAPGVLADLVLVGGLAWALYGLVAGRFAVVAAGLVVGAIGRETLIPLLPLVIAWLALGPPWRELAPRRRALLGGAAAACVLLPYALLRVASDPFSLPDTFGLSDFGATPETPPALTDVTLVGALDDLPGSAPELGEHALRVLTPHVLPLALLGAALWLILRRPAASLRRLPPLFWLGIGAWALVAAQPLALSPEYAAYNETRLSALGLVPLLVALAALLRDVELRAPRPAAAAVVAALLLVASLHHLYATVGPATASQFVALEAAVAAVLVALATILGRHRSRPPCSGGQNTSRNGHGA